MSTQLYALVDSAGAIVRRQEFATFDKSWDELEDARDAAASMVEEIKSGADAELGLTPDEEKEVADHMSAVRTAAERLAVMAPRLAPAKGYRWLPDNPPAFDPANAVRVQIAPIPADAIEVPYRIDPIPMADIKAKRKAELAAIRFGKETGGVIVAGVAIRTDRESQQLIDSLHRALVDGIVPSVRFKTAAGPIVTADTAAAAAFRTAVVAHVQACRTHEADLAEAIDAAKNVTAVLAIDLDAGWPA